MSLEPARRNEIAWILDQAELLNRSGYERITPMHDAIAAACYQIEKSEKQIQEVLERFKEVNERDTRKLQAPSVEELREYVRQLSEQS